MFYLYLITLRKEILADLADRLKNRQNPPILLPAKINFILNPPKLIPAKFDLNSHPPKQVSANFDYFPKSQIFLEIPMILL